MSAGKSLSMNDWHTTLKKMRLRARLTQAQLAELLGLDQTSISSYEVGRRHPTTDLLDQWAKACGGYVDVVYPGEESLTQLPPSTLADLRDLATGWSSLPENTRQAILLLARVAK